MKDDISPIIDNREQKPWQFPGIDNPVYKRLNVGDYTLEGFEHVFAVERKSLNDLATSLGTDRERFEAEVQRAQDLKEFAVVVEEPRRLVDSHTHRTWCPNYYSKLPPKTITATEESWTDKYEVLEWYWCEDRDAAMQKALQLLDSWYLEHGTDLM